MLSAAANAEQGGQLLQGYFPVSWRDRLPRDGITYYKGKYLIFGRRKCHHENMENPTNFPLGKGKAARSRRRPKRGSRNLPLKGRLIHPISGTGSMGVIYLIVLDQIKPSRINVKN